MGKLSTIWKVLTTDNWILINYTAHSRYGFPFSLNLPDCVEAKYYKDRVVISQWNAKYRLTQQDTRSTKATTEPHKNATTRQKELL